MPITYFHGKEGEMVFDDRFAPIFLTNNTGKWDPDQLRHWYEISRRELMRSSQAGNKVFFIGDLTNVASPDAVTRKAIAELQDEFDAPFKGKDTWIGQCYVIANPLMRGLVTAVNWMTSDGLVAPPSTAPNIPAALKIATMSYAKYGLELPPFPDDYQFPPYEKLGRK